MRVTKTVIASVAAPINFSAIQYDRFSSWNTLLRAVAYCIRFCKNCKMLQQEQKGAPLSSDELMSARNAIIKDVQKMNFNVEIKQLIKGDPLSKTSKLLHLNAFLDDKGVIRVGGRLRNADIRYSAQHQMVLPAKHIVTRLIISHEHAKQLHAGPEGTLAAVRNLFWPLSAR